MTARAFVPVARTADGPPSTMQAVPVGRKALLLAPVAGTFYAIAGRCTHQQGPLAEGSLWGAVATCPYHGGQFLDVRTGTVVSAPPPCPAVVYAGRSPGTPYRLHWVVNTSAGGGIRAAPTALEERLDESCISPRTDC